MKACNGGRAHHKVERKTVEKCRRMHMKSLCFKLASVIPKEHRTIAKDVLSQQDNLEQATSYIRKLQESIEELKQRRLMHTSSVVSNDTTTIGIPTPVIEVRHQDQEMEVLLICGPSKSFRFHEVINVLEEEGAEVVNASFAVVGDKIFHTIHSQAISSRIGLEASRVSERLKQLVK